MRPVRLYNQIADKVFAQDRADILGAATLDTDVTAAEAKYYARSNLAMADAGIVAWHAKYLYQYWRPVTGIRTLDAFNEGQQSSSPKDRENWLPLGAQNTNSSRGFNITQPFPSYRFGRAVVGGAFFEVLRSFVKSPADQTFMFQSDEFNGEQAFNRMLTYSITFGALMIRLRLRSRKTYCKLRKLNFNWVDVANFDPSSGDF